MSREVTVLGADGSSLVTLIENTRTIPGSRGIITVDPDGLGTRFGGSIEFAGGSTLPLSAGGTGASLSDPNADRIFFWDDSAGSTAFLTPGNSLSINGTTLDTVQDIRTTATPEFAKIGAGTSPAGADLLRVSGNVAGNYVAFIQNTNGSAGQSYGPLIRAGTNGSDIALQVDDASANNLLSVAGDGTLNARGEISTFGASASLARLRLRGFYTSSPSNPPTNECDIIVIDDGVSPVMRFRYNDAGAMKVGDVALV